MSTSAAAGAGVEGSWQAGAGPWEGSGGRAGPGECFRFALEASAFFVNVALFPLVLKHWRRQNCKQNSAKNSQRLLHPDSCPQVFIFHNPGAGIKTKK